MSKLTEWINNKTESIVKDINLEILENIKMLGRLEKESVNVYPVVSYIFTKGNKLEEMAVRSFQSPEEIDVCLKNYQYIMYILNKEIKFVPSKENFCQFMGWTANVYDINLHNDTDDIRNVMQMIEDYLIDSQLSAGQGGIIKTSLTKFRSQVAGSNGHGLVTQKEANEENRFKNRFKSTEQLERELDGLKTFVIGTK